MARVDRLRIWLAAGTVLLLLVLLAAMGYSRYRAGKGWLNGLKKHAGVSITQETDGFTYSQSSGGRTVFTLHAAKAFQHTQDLITLHDVVLTVFESGGRADKIYGNEFEWNKSKGIARAVGMTTMDIQLQTPKEGAAAADNMLHVKTSGLVFLRNLGVGATSELVEFDYAGLHCTAKGAEFDKDPSELHLLADVRVDGVFQGENLSLRAARADLSREKGLAAFVQPVVVYGARHGQSQNAVAHLREHGEIDSMEASGAVSLQEGTRHLTADRGEARFGAANHLEAAKFTGSVRLLDANPESAADGTAAELQLGFDGAGRMTRGTANGGAKLLLKRAGSNGVPLMRQVHGDLIDAALVPNGAKSSQLKTLHISSGKSGGAVAQGESESLVAGVREVRTSRVAADDLMASFVGQSARGAGVKPDIVSGRGHTELRETGANGLERVSSGDALRVVFAQVAGPKTQSAEVASATQDGHVIFQSRTPAKAAKPDAKAKADDVVSGAADHAAYDAATNLLLLTGNAHAVNGTTSVTATSIAVNQLSGDADAHGNVIATLAGNVSASGTASTASRSSATHVSAAHAVLHHAADTAEFEAGEGHPARMWQDASQVEANRIVLDGKAHTLVATPTVLGVVHSVFAGTAVESAHAAGAAAKPAEPRILRVESRGLQYSDSAREAVFTGPVVMSGSGGDVRAKRAVATFAPAKSTVASSALGGLPAGSLERVVATGDVRIAEPGRQGSGEQLTYIAADGSLLLTGTPGAPPHVTDAQQGTVTGASLLLRPGESTIVVTGAASAESGVKPADGSAKPQRARVDTKVRQQGK